MLGRHPISAGLLFGFSASALVWLSVWVPTAVFAHTDAGLLIGFLLLIVQLVVFVCLNRNALRKASSWQRGIRFEVAVLVLSIILWGVEFSLFSSQEIVSVLDPHTSMFQGLSYLLLWIAAGICTMAELLCALLQTVICAVREHRASKHS